MAKEMQKKPSETTDTSGNTVLLEQKSIKIPPQYENMPSELVEEMLSGEGLPIDEKERERVSGEQKEIVSAIGQKEIEREDAKEKMYQDLFKGLSSEDRKSFSSHMEGTISQLSAYVKGEKSLDDLSGEEQWVVGKLQTAYQEFQKSNSGQPFSFELAREIDQKVLNNLRYKLAFDSLDQSKEQENEQKAGEILKEIKKGPIGGDRLGADGEGRERENNPKDIFQTSEKNDTFSEKEIDFKKQVKSFLDVVLMNKEFQEAFNKRRKTLASIKKVDEKAISDPEVLSTLDEGISATMYNFIHNTGIPFDEVINNMSAEDKSLFENGGDDFSKRLQGIVAQTPNIRFITDEEHVRNGQPDQRNFVWFKGEAKRLGENPREVRFYINSSPGGAKDIAAYLAKVSNEVSKYGMRLNFKFRKNIDEYDRSDTCVAYLYMPEVRSSEDKSKSDLLLEQVKNLIAQIPQDSIRKQNSFFTKRITDGLSFAEDSRKKSEKKGQSYTSQITSTISRVSKEFIGKDEKLTPDLLEKISQRATEELKNLNYFSN